MLMSLKKDVDTRKNKLKKWNYQTKNLYRDLKDRLIYYKLKEIKFQKKVKIVMESRLLIW